MRTWLLMALSAILLLFAAHPCFAEHGEGGGERSMFDGVLDLSIWTLVVFLLLVFVLTKFAWKPMLEGLDKRERDIAAAVEDAKAARDEAAALHQQMVEIRQKANDEARQLVDDARKAAEQIAADRKARSDADIAQERERLRREMDVARDQVVKEVLSQTANLATTIASKVLRRQLNPDDHRALVDESLAEMSRAMNQRHRTNGAGASA